MILSSEKNQWLLLFLLWLLLFFPGWSREWVVKLWELKQSAGADRSVQLTTLHPLGEMAALLELKQYLASYPEETVAIKAEARDPQIPLATDATILRAVLYPLRVEWNPAAETVVQVVSPGSSCQADICWEVSR